MSQYIQEACRNIKVYLKQRNGDENLENCTYVMPQKAPGPLSNEYHPKINISFKLNATDDAYYQSLIRILQ